MRSNFKKQLLQLALFFVTSLGLGISLAHAGESYDEGGRGRALIVCKKTYSTCNSQLREDSNYISPGCFWFLDEVNSRRAERCEYARAGEHATCLPPIQAPAGSMRPDGYSGNCE